MDFNIFLSSELLKTVKECDYFHSLKMQKDCSDERTSMEKYHF